MDHAKYRQMVSSGLFTPSANSARPRAGDLLDRLPSSGGEVLSVGPFDDSHEHRAFVADDVGAEQLSTVQFQDTRGLPTRSSTAASTLRATTASRALGPVKTALPLESRVLTSANPVASNAALRAGIFRFMRLTPRRSAA